MKRSSMLLSLLIAVLLLWGAPMPWGSLGLGVAPAYADDDDDDGAGQSTGPVVVDDSGTVVGPALTAATGSAQIVFEFEGEQFSLQASPGELGIRGSLFFPNTTCSTPAFAFPGRMATSSWAALKLTITILTATGTELWVQDGGLVASFLAQSRTDEDPPFGCTTSAGKGIPRDTGPILPMRDTGIILEDEFPPPYNLINLPSLPKDSG